MPLIAYTRDIPDAPNNPSVDQPDMKQNTNAIDDIIDVDHFSFDEANGGLHRQVRMPVNGLPITTVGQGALYTRTTLGKSELYYTSDNTGTQYQLTSNTPITSTTGQNGVGSITWYTFLPNGFIIAQGKTTNSVNGSTITLSRTFTSFTYIGLTVLGPSSTTTDRPNVAVPITINEAAGTMVIGMRDTNNNPETVAHNVYFYVVGF